MILQRIRIAFKVSQLEFKKDSDLHCNNKEKASNIHGFEKAGNSYNNRVEITENFFSPKIFLKRMPERQ